MIVKSAANETSKRDCDNLGRFYLSEAFFSCISLVMEPKCISRFESEARRCYGSQTWHSTLPPKSTIYMGSFDIYKSV